MIYTAGYTSPLGEMLLSADAQGLTGLWFVAQKHYPVSLPEERAEGDNPILEETRRWLDIYFSGVRPDFTPPLRPRGSEFRQAVWELLLTIPYGETRSYGELAHTIAAQRGLPRMSAQAVGGAVGHNPISLIIPCHRVVGQNGSLTGYDGGIPRKAALLRLEGAYQDSFFVPKRGTAL